MERRKFISSSGKIALGTCMVSCASLLTQCVSSMEVVVLETSPDKLVLHLKDVQDKKYVIARHSKFTEPIFIQKQEDGFLALLLKCTHKGCEIDPFPTVLICPCHGSEFNTKGEVQSPPASQPLQKFNTELKQDKLIVYV